MANDSGYVKLYRKSIESDIWRKPPLYWKIWSFILMKAQHQDFGNVPRGAVRTTIDELCEAGSYYVGFRKVVPKRREIYRILAYLSATRERSTNDTPNGNTNDTMIDTTNDTRGMLIKVHKYAVYQSFENHERHNERHNEAPMNDTSNGQRTDSPSYIRQEKRIKNKECKKNVVGADAPMTPPTPQQAEEYAHEIGFDLDGEHFCDYYSASGWEIRKGIPMKDWKAAIRNWKRKDTKQETRKETQNEKHDGVFERESDYSKPIDWLERK